MFSVLARTEKHDKTSTENSISTTVFPSVSKTLVQKPFIENLNYIAYR